MSTRRCIRLALPMLGFLFLALPMLGLGQDKDKKDPDKKFGGKGFGGKGFGGQQDRKLVQQFDKDKDGRLDNEERKAARDFIKKSGGGGRPGFGGPGKGGFGKGGFGGPGGGFGPPPDFLTKPLLDALDTDKDGKLNRAEMEAGLKLFMARADKDKKDSLDESQLAETLNDLLPPPKDFPAPPPGAGRFGPGTGLARGILRLAVPDTDPKDAKASLKTLAKAGESLFTDNDKNKDGKLDDAELGAAVAKLFFRPGFGGPGFGGPGKGGPGKGGPGGFGKGKMDPPKPGPSVTPADVKNFPDSSLYEPNVLRTLFLEFENKDWEAELADFIRTDVEVPVTLTVDGKKYPNVGVHFRGMSSLMMVSPGYKRSFGLSLDFVDPKQRLYGYKTLNLLNSNGDPSMLSTVLFSHLTRPHIPAPKANLVKVVVNGESWGVYVNVQQFNKDFLAENYKTTKGARWKVKGSPGGAGGLDYIGENVDDYKRRYTITSKDDDKSWKALINLCKVLCNTPADKLEETLSPILDIDGALWFLAMDIGLINSDGYWTRASDFNIYLDPKGKFHIIPHDMNEAFQPGFGGGKGGPGGGKGGFGGPGGGKGGFGGMGGSGLSLDPLIGLDDARKPLRSKLLAVPKLRTRYLEHLRTLANQLDWKTLGPVVAQYRNLIEKEVALDTRKLSTFEAFELAVAETPAAGGGRTLPLRHFADQRRAYLLNHPEIKKLPPGK